MNLFTDLKWRGLIHQTTDDSHLPAWLEEKQRTVYVGFDPTAESLHVGSLLGLIVLRRMQLAGHKPIAVVGGATGMIGDPSGKSAERNLLSKGALEHNVEAMGAQMRRFLDFDAGSCSAQLLNNLEWTASWSYLELLRDVGKNFPVNVMLAKDSVKSRLGRGDDDLTSGDSTSGMSYTEFSYMLLQAYDFVHLSEKHGCELQAGGSDQWGNITAGVDLARRMRGVQLYGMTWPLLTKADGTKMGKTESGAVWLSADRTSPYDFYQYWINVDDGDVGSCLRTLTELSHEEIVALDDVRQSDPGKRESQRRLAEALTQLVHGKEGLSNAKRATEILFGAEISDLSDAQLTAIFADVPSEQLSASQLDGEGMPIVEALCQSGLSRSKGDARRTVQQGGAYVNNHRVDGLDASLTRRELASETIIVLRSGKKKYALLKFAE